MRDDSGSASMKRLSRHPARRLIFRTSGKGCRRYRLRPGWSASRLTDCVFWVCGCRLRLNEMDRLGCRLGKAVVIGLRRGMIYMSSIRRCGAVSIDAASRSCCLVSCTVKRRLLSTSVWRSGISKWLEAHIVHLVAKWLSFGIGWQVSRSTKAAATTAICVAVEVGSWISRNDEDEKNDCA